MEISSEIDLAGKDGGTTRALYDLETLMMGLKSTSGRKPIAGSKAGTAIVGTLIG
jgi:hypothetical protein